MNYATEQVAERATFTDRQAKAWPEAIAEAQQHIGETIPADLWRWTVQWSDEVRPGRGRAFHGVWACGEYFVEVSMDVYGYPTVSVASLYLIHSSGWEDCECDVCVKEREADED